MLRVPIAIDPEYLFVGLQGPDGRDVPGMIVSDFVVAVLNICSRTSIRAYRDALHCKTLFYLRITLMENC